MNRLLHAFSGETSLMPFEESLTGSEFGPPVDIYEDDQKLTFKVEVPGVDEKDIKVEIENNILTVHGERKLEKEIKEENFSRMERHYGVFSRSFTVPSTVDRQKIEANYAHGVLAIQMPKRAEAKPKTNQRECDQGPKGRVAGRARAPWPSFLASGGAAKMTVKSTTCSSFATEQ